MRICVCGKKLEKKTSSMCRNCLNNIFGNTTKGDLVLKRSSYQSWRSSVRSHANKIYFNSNKTKACFVCGYDKFVEICHIESVSAFSDTSTINEINDIDNLVALYPNHHKEFDAGFLNINTELVV